MKFKFFSSGAGEFEFQNLTPPELNFKISKSHSPELKFQNSKFQNLSFSSGAQAPAFQNSKFKFKILSAPELNFKIQIQNLTPPELKFKIQNLTLRSWRISKFKKLRENFEIQKAAGEFSREFQLRAQLSKTSRLNSQKLQDSTLKNSGKEPKNHEIMKFVFCPKQQKNSF